MVRDARTRLPHRPVRTAEPRRAADPVAETDARTPLVTIASRPQPSPAPAGRSGPGNRYRWVAMGVVLIGTFMVILDTSIVNVALDPIAREFDSLHGVEWIVTAYLLAIAVSMVATGWLADRFGRKAVFMGSLGLFTVGSLACALAVNLPMIVACRVVEGLGGGALMPVAMAMVYELFEPEERGKAFGLWGVAAMAAPAVGPILGGWLSTSFTWRWLFLVNVPIGLVGVVAARRLLRDVGFREHRRFDTHGFVFAAVGLVLVLLAAQEGTTWGLRSPRFVVAMVVGLALLTTFTVHALRARQPLIQMRLFGIPIFSLTMAVILTMTIGQYARLVFIPLEMERLRALSPLDVGLLLLPSAVGIASTMAIGGRLADVIGARVPSAVGLAILAGSMWPLAHIGPHTSLTWIAVVLLIGGIGTGLGMMPNTVAAMNSTPSALISQASAVRNLVRQVAGALGTAVLTAVWTARLGPVSIRPPAPDAHSFSAYNVLFLIAMWALVAAFALALFLPGRRRTLELQAERRADGPLPGMAE